MSIATLAPAARWTSAGVPAAVLGFVLSSCGDAGTGEVQAVVPQAPPEQEIVTEAFGVVKALSVRSIYVDLPAEVTEVHVIGAQSVKRGDVLLTLDLEEYETLLAARESTLAIERLALSRLEQNLERDSVTFSSEYQTTRNQLAARETELADLEAMATPQTVGIEMQRKTVARLEADVAALRRDVERPFLDGTRVVVDLDRAIVTDLTVHRGDSVGPGRLLLRLVDLDSLIVEADVPEEFIRDVRMGAPVTIIPLADPARESYGTVRRIAGMAVNRSGETIVPVQVSIDDDQGYLLPNFNVDVAIGTVESVSE